MLGDVRTLAQATDSKDAGVDLVQDAAARIDRVRLAVTRRAAQVRVAMLEWLDPVFVGGHWVPQLIEYAGGVDLLGLPGEPSEQRSWEEVAAARPEVVIVAPCGYDVDARPRGGAASTRTQLHALGAERIVVADASAWFSRPGPRLVDGLEWLGHALHPDLVPEPPGGRQCVLSSTLAWRARRAPATASDAEHRRDDRDDRDDRRHAPARELLDREGREQAADQAAEVAAERDARHGEREAEVDRQDRHQPRLDQVDVAVAGHHDRRAEQAVDRARGAERRRVGRRGSSRRASPHSSDAK